MWWVTYYVNFVLLINISKCSVISRFYFAFLNKKKVCLGINANSCFEPRAQQLNPDTGNVYGTLHNALGKT